MLSKEQVINGLKENLCSLCAYGSQNMDTCNIRECDNRDYIKALEQQPCDDCVSKSAVIALCFKYLYNKNDGDEFYKHFMDMPPVTPTHGTCKDCKHNKKSHNAITLCYTTCDLGHRFELREPSTFYCADFEKRGDLDGSN